jgi:hypothetical protein
MRIRQVRTEFWSDEVVGPLPDAVKLFYIGLWQVADDAGWLTWAPAQIGAILYPYRSAKRRESDIEAWAGALERVHRLRRLDCGCAEIPTLSRHQRVSGVQSFKARDTHRNHSDTQSPLSDTQSPLSDSPVEGGNVEGGIGKGGGIAPDPFDAPETPVLTWLAQHGCYIHPGNGYHRNLVTATDRHGSDAILAMLERLASAGMKPGDTKGYLFGAIDALDAAGRPKLADIDKAAREEAEDRTHQARLARTQRELAALRGEPV